MASTGLWSRQAIVNSERLRMDWSGVIFGPTTLSSSTFDGSHVSRSLYRDVSYSSLTFWEITSLIARDTHGE